MLRVNKVMTLNCHLELPAASVFLFYFIFPRTYSEKSQNHLCITGAFHVRERFETFIGKKKR